LRRLDEVGHAQEHMLAHLATRLGGCVYISEDNMYSIDCDDYTLLKVTEENEGQNGVAVFMKSQFREEEVRSWVRKYIESSKP
jgi:hypothetical protein